MDVRFSPEQRALRDSVVQAVDRLGPHAVGQLDDRERAAKLEAAVAASGWRELRVATEDGAPWASAVEVAIVAEELARGRADVSFLGPTLATELRRLAGAPGAAGPETVLLTTDLAAPARAEDGGVAPDAAGASTALVLVPASRGYALGEVAVPAGRTGLDLTRPAVRVAPAEAPPVVGQTKMISADDVDHWTALGLATTCADLVGAMHGAIDVAVDHARHRHQYGEPIGSFQAVQHMLADAVVHMEGARSATLHAAWAVDASAPPEALAAAAAAKAYSARAARAACEIVIQVHGGMGNTWECLAHVYLRRALHSTDVLGGVGPSLARVLEHRGVGGTSGLR
ncbi:MAG TPA: acyl-CoA dehydrogenase family protein [Acidimicrobiales bacterium]|nr:acyl-CoA dehydrogenase family protein [Acidimicrobiales bacterium]